MVRDKAKHSISSVVMKILKEVAFKASRKRSRRRKRRRRRDRRPRISPPPTAPKVVFTLCMTFVAARKTDWVRNPPHPGRFFLIPVADIGDICQQ